MHFHQNHSWCSRSHWNDGDFSCKYMVSIKRHPNYDLSVSYHNQEIDVDWKDLVEEKKILDSERLEQTRSSFAKIGHVCSEKELRKMSLTACPTPHSRVMDWLSEIKPISNSYNKVDAGWCIGNEEYRSKDVMGITFWFVRKKDAMSFIKRWSHHKKPTTYFDYFKDDRRELIDGKLVKVESFKR